jgi:2-polyprenyl-3-methyl-5-hydroxy-6-metoxy-1,4-benzoquinol methylase
VYLSDFSHIDEQFYEDSHMHDHPPCAPHIMKSVNDEDDIRRFHDFYPLFVGKSLLDFGCGNGGFLALAKTAAVSVTGIEPDKCWTDLHDRTGIPVVSSFSSLPDKAQFDVVTMFHVLEHIPDPIPILKKILNYLKSSGGGGEKADS